MASPYLALRPDRNGPASRESAAGSKNPPDLSVESVKNSEKLCKALNDVGYKTEQYVGWVFMQDELPVHHSFVVLGNSIVDPTVSLLCKDIEQLERLNPGSDHETRINLMNLYKEKQFLPNHIKCIFGKVDDLYVYVGASGTAEEGIKRNALLRKEYPDHPCFRDVKNGMTVMQRMIMDE